MADELVPVDFAAIINTRSEGSSNFGRVNRPVQGIPCCDEKDDHRVMIHPAWKEPGNKLPALLCHEHVHFPMELEISMALIC